MEIAALKSVHQSISFLYVISCCLCPASRCYEFLSAQNFPVHLDLMVFIKRLSYLREYIHRHICFCIKHVCLKHLLL